MSESLAGTTLDTKVFNLDKHFSLEQWVETISEKGLPALAATVRAIEKIDESAEYPIDILADYIKQDPGLTSHILRHTQGAYRIPLKGKHNTINRAIVMLGFKEIKSLCLSLSLIEDILKANPRVEFMSELGISFHAAIQARNIAFECGERNCEEIFTSALLSKLGNLAFWGLGGEQANELSNAIRNASKLPLEDIEKQCLGFSLEQLSQELSAAWKLDSYSFGPNSRFTDYIKLGFQIAEASVHGWESEEFKKTLEDASQLSSLPIDSTEKIIRESSEIAVRYALGFGVPGLSQTLYKISYEDIENAAVEEPQNKKETLLDSPNESFQLKTLKSLSTLLEAGTNIHELVITALEGMHKGLAIDRAIFCLLTPNRKRLLPKTFANSYSEQLLDIFTISIDSCPVIHSSISSDAPLWITSTAEDIDYGATPSALKTILDKNDYILAPVSVSNKPIGVFYIDRGVRRSPFLQSEFEALKHLVFQVRLALEHLHMMQGKNRE